MCKYKSMIAIAAVVVLIASTTISKAQCIENQKLASPSGTSGPDGFGNAVSISGDTAVVAAYGRDCDALTACGAVFVYRFDGDSWIEKQQLTASEPGQFFGFGKSVSVDGDTIVVGAAYADCESGRTCGAAYVFRFNGTRWVEQQKLVASDAEEGDTFGNVVSVYGDIAVVGAMRDDDSTGAAYVFRFNGATWVEQQKLTASDARSQGRFGVSVSASNETILVGAYRMRGFTDDGYIKNNGAAYVFRINGTEWIEEQILIANDTVPSVRLGEEFGWSVSLSGDKAMVSTRRHTCSTGQSCGSVYVFRYDGSSWVDEQKLTATITDDIGRFGNSVSLLGNTAIVGAVGAYCESGHSCGAAYVYRFDGICWTEQRRLNASDANMGDNFGIAVAVYYGTVLVGAFNGHCLGGSCGSAYVFDITPGSPCFDCDGDGILDVLEIDCNGNNQADSCDISKGESADCNDNGVPDECEVIARGQFELGNSPRKLSMDGDVVAVCSSGEDENGNFRNETYVFQSTDTEWGLDQILFAPDGITNDRFCESIATHGNRIIVGAPGTYASDLSDGSAYIFEKNSHGWSQRAKLTLPEGEICEDFGYTVALSGGLAFVSAVKYNKAPFHAVYTYRLVGETWEFESKLTSPNENIYLSYGQSLSTNGDTLVVGAPNIWGIGEGAIYVYKRIDGQWIQQAEFTGGNIFHGQFGLSVFIKEDVIVVGDPTNAALRIGNAGHVYRLQNSEWVLEAVLKASRSSGINRLGRSIAMDGDRILLKGVVWSGPKSGEAVVVFHRQGDKWIEEQILFAPAGDTVAYFTDAIGISGQTAFIGGSVGLQGQTHGVLYSYGLSGPDCNDNGVLDSCDVTAGTSQDCTSNGFLDECEADCNDNGVADSCDIEDGVELDCNNNRVPDGCDIKQHESQDCNDNHVPDECESDGDHDGSPGDCDQCPDSDTSETVVVNSCDSGVANVFLEDGCNMMDKLSECSDKAGRHGNFVSCITKLTKRWRKHGLLTEKEAARIVRCAAQDNKGERRRNMSGRR